MRDGQAGSGSPTLNGGSGRPGKAAPPRRPTLEQVARRAGVGRGTVSRVINGSPRVSEHTRAAVEAAVDELGYVPNRVARALAAGSADAIALVIPEPETRFFAEPYFSGILHGDQRRTGPRRHAAAADAAARQKEQDRFAQYAAAHRIDGVLLVSVHEDDPLPDLLASPDARRAQRPPLGRRVPLLRRRDNIGGARAAVAHLIARGRETVATITGPPDMYAARCRVDGYREAIRDAGHPEDELLVARGDFTEEGGRGRMRRLLADRPGIDAVFCASDVMAAGARMRPARGGPTRAGRRGTRRLRGLGRSPGTWTRRSPPSASPSRRWDGTMARVLLELLGKWTPGAAYPAAPTQAAPSPRPPGAGDRTHRVLPTELIRRGSS